MTSEITIAEYRALIKKRPKYGNKKVEIDGYTFDSLAEAARYKELRLLESAGRIEVLEVHPRFTLQHAFTDRQGQRHQAVTYSADFAYREITGPFVASVVEDVKGKETDVFRVKSKLFRFNYPDLELRIIASGAAARGIQKP